MNIYCILIYLFLSFWCVTSRAQDDFSPQADIATDDLNVGGDIFSNFSDDQESAQVIEDEKFYRYGRFFSVNLGLGTTSFTGNRGKAYHDQPPSYLLSVNYFFNFQSSFILGFQFSKHTMFIDTYVKSYQETDDGTAGAISISMLRPFFGYRYYVDTTDTATPITYSNPYVTIRMEYWYQTNKFTERNNIETQKGGGIGLGLGGGLEFPIEFKKSYLNLEFIFHQVNFFDKDTSDYQQIPNDPKSKYGYDNLNGFAYSLFASYNVSW